MLTAGWFKVWDVTPATLPRERQCNLLHYLYRRGGGKL